MIRVGSSIGRTSDFHSEDPGSSPGRRSTVKRVAFSDLIGGSLYRMRECWRLGIDIDPGPRVTGAGAGTLVQDWDAP